MFVRVGSLPAYGAVLTVLSCGVDSVRAQTQLPEIVVTTPSPIVRRPPARVAPRERRTLLPRVVQLASAALPAGAGSGSAPARRLAQFRPVRRRHWCSTRGTSCCPEAAHG